MDKFGPLINAAYRAIDNANTLLENEKTPFNVMYKQYKTLQSLWFRMIEESSDGNRRLEEVCVDLELTLSDCDKFLKEHAPKKEEDKEDTPTE